MWKEKPERIAVMYQPGARAYTLLIWLTWTRIRGQCITTTIINVIFWASVSLSALATPNAAPDLPPTGSSLFDQLFLEVMDGHSRYQIPFPFEDLTRHIAGQLNSNNSRADGSIAKLLIPMGRSLQRDGLHPFAKHRQNLLLEPSVFLEPGFIPRTGMREWELLGPIFAP